MMRVRFVATGEIIEGATSIHLWGPIVRVETIARNLAGYALDGKSGCVVINVNHYVLGDVEVLP